MKPTKAVADIAAGVDAITGKAIAKSIADAIQGTDSATPTTGGGTAHDRDIDDAVQGVDAITGKVATKALPMPTQGTDARALTSAKPSPTQARELMPGR